MLLWKTLTGSGVESEMFLGQKCLTCEPDGTNTFDQLISMTFYLAWIINLAVLKNLLQRFIS